MPNYARITNGKIVEIITIDGSPADFFHPEIVSTIHEIPTGSPAVVGYTFDGSVFLPPPVVVVVNPSTMSPLVFQSRFHADELTAIAQAAMGNPALFLYLIQTASASQVDLKDARTIAGIQALEAAKIITSDRAAAILTP